MFKKSFSIVQIAAFLVASATANHATAQMANQPIDCKNQYPCAECAVFDNNGNDLKTFIIDGKRELDDRGSKVLDYSGGDWGYLLVKTGQVPSVSSRWPKKGDLNYTQFIRATYALNKTGGSNKATWWARECSLPNGPMVNIKVDDEGKLGMETVRYPKIMSELESKKFTLVEYVDTMYNARDYDLLLKNHIMLAAGSVTDPSDYKAIIDFYNGFLGKFTYVTDPVLENKIFITFFKGNTHKYVGIFHAVNGKLSGKLELADLEYEKDRDVLINRALRGKSGMTVFIYGDETFGMDKNIIKYARANNIKLKRRVTNTPKKFNEE
jgi:hypothetical protein